MEDTYRRHIRHEDRYSPRVALLLIGGASLIFWVTATALISKFF
jgi:hypothetical protein